MTTPSSDANIWQPIIDRPFGLHPVAADARPSEQQQAHFGMLAVAMRADLAETNLIIDALQLCERRYGFAKIKPHLLMITAAVENAVALCGNSVTLIGMQRKMANAGLFVGSLLERCAEVDASTRRFPKSDFENRLSSPWVEFEDCLLGANIAKKLGLLEEKHPERAQPYSALAAECRKRLGLKGIVDIEALGRRHIAARPEDCVACTNHFIRDAEKMIRDKGIKSPPHWREMVRRYGLAKG